MLIDARIGRIKFYFCTTTPKQWNQPCWKIICYQWHCNTYITWPLLIGRQFSKFANWMTKSFIYPPWWSKRLWMEVLSKRGFFVYHEMINLSMVFTDCRVLCRFIPTLRVSIHEIFTLVWGTVLTDPFVVFLAERSRSWIESLRTGTGLSGSFKVIPPELCQSLTD